MKIVWSSDAIEMADYFFEVTRHLYGQKIYQKYLDKVDSIQKQLLVMTRTGTLEPALADEDGEYRFRGQARCALITTTTQMNNKNIELLVLLRRVTCLYSAVCSVQDT